MVIFPERMQRVQTDMRLGPFAVWTLMVCRLGRVRFLVLRCEWLTFIPTSGRLPQISHTRDIFLYLLSSVVMILSDRPGVKP